MSRQAGPTFADINAIKADFDRIYREPDPRAYYTVLGGLDYVIPEVARPIFLQLAERCLEDRGEPLTVLDIGCSYGVNAALLRHGVTLRQLRERYMTPSMQALPPEKVAEYDARFFSAWPAREDIRVIGIDTSPEAIAYGRKSGLLADGAAVNLETDSLTPRQTQMLSKVDLVISTGCIGYVTHKTFEKILEAAEKPPWVASFVLRMFEYNDIAKTLARQALETEKLDGATFVQRRFRDAGEMARTVDALEARGVSTEGKEAEGLLHAELFVSRPERSIASRSLTEIVSLSSGIGRSLGDRPRLVRRAASEIAA